MGLFEVIKGSGLCFCLQLHRKRPEAETAEGTNVQSPLSPPSVLRSVFTHTVTAPHRVLKHTHTHTPEDLVLPGSRVCKSPLYTCGTFTYQKILQVRSTDAPTVQHSTGVGQTVNVIFPIWIFTWILSQLSLDVSQIK